ncbi:conserved hypothetical protein [Formosa agariphila KMM 3901]|uniref:Uncharacterized protein n=1 Tax=Formosa agariphila (strain DSM 15362 / KCTC 12365 / LMG 23005 / KMM 3901 / M-2Alg 35-1) TaxID=1347342 RepID=T2KQ33_FORAG|nr:hypothetical protein [Formosa agariphila]CDF80566.1 conserved hypothetical protein [Formosa agariphila KMM 3901]
MKKNGQEIQEFGNLITKTFNKNTKIQTHWAEAISVNWEDKTMVAKGTADNLEFHDVLLGVGDCFRKPKKGARCLVGTILNQEAATFLMACTDLEETVITANQTQLTVKETGFIIKQNNESLKDVLNDMIDEINKIKVIYGNTINILEMTAIKERLNTILIE